MCIYDPYMYVWEREGGEERGRKRGECVRVCARARKAAMP